MPAELLVLRLVHILGGIFWLGSGLFTTLFLVPALATVGPAAGQVMGALQQRRLMTVMPVVAVLTMLSGVRLYQIASGGFASAYVQSRMGQVFLWSGIAAVIAFVLSLAVTRPAMVRAGRLGATMSAAPESERAARTAEMDRLRRRGATASTIAMILLVAAAAGMAVARYVG